LVEGAEAEEVSLNQHMVALLAERSAISQVRRQLTALRRELGMLGEGVKRLECASGRLEGSKGS
jgi:hypothetical protein